MPDSAGTNSNSYWNKSDKERERIDRKDRASGRVNENGENHDYP